MCATPSGLLQRVNALNRKMADVHARLASFEAVSYDPSLNEFSNGSGIDWFVHEPIETAHVGSCSLTDSHLDAFVCWPVRTWKPIDGVEVYMQVKRSDDSDHFIVLPRVCTVRDLLTSIHGFYKTPVSRKDLIGSSDDFVAIGFHRCNGGVRYKGLYEDRNGRLTVLLGS